MAKPTKEEVIQLAYEYGLIERVALRRKLTKKDWDRALNGPFPDPRHNFLDEIHLQPEPMTIQAWVWKDSLEAVKYDAIRHFEITGKLP